MNNTGYIDEQIWQEHIDFCQSHINKYQQNIEKLKKDRVKNKLSLQAIKKSCSLPKEVEMNKVLRYETTIERQLYKAVNQLERLQRFRAGDHVPAPVQVDLNITGA